MVERARAMERQRKQMLKDHEEGKCYQPESPGSARRDHREREGFHTETYTISIMKHSTQHEQGGDTVATKHSLQ